MALMIFSIAERLPFIRLSDRRRLTYVSSTRFTERGRTLFRYIIKVIESEFQASCFSVMEGKLEGDFVLTQVTLCLFRALFGHHPNCSAEFLEAYVDSLVWCHEANIDTG